MVKVLLTNFLVALFGTLSASISKMRRPIEIFCIFEKIWVQKSLRLSADIRILLISAITRELKFQADFCYISRKALFIIHPKIFSKSPIPTEIFFVEPLSLWHCPEMRHFWELCSDRQQQINQIGIAHQKLLRSEKNHMWQIRNFACTKKFVFLREIKFASCLLTSLFYFNFNLRNVFF